MTTRRTRRSGIGRHPYVGLAVFDDANGPSHRCSASLLSPTVVLTAGHCTDGTVAARVWLDEDVQSNSEYPLQRGTSYDGIPYTNPDFCIGCGNGLPGFAQRDVGIIVLTEPVPTSVVSEYAELPSAGLVDELSSKARSRWSATGGRSGSSAAARRCGRGSGSD